MSWLARLKNSDTDRPPAKPAKTAKTRDEGNLALLAGLASGSACLEKTAPVRVRCCDCRHFEPDTVGFGQGIGSCAIGDPSEPVQRCHMDHHMKQGHGRRGFYFVTAKPALWPRAERVCSGFDPPTSTNIRGEAPPQSTDDRRL